MKIEKKDTVFVAAEATAPGHTSRAMRPYKRIKAGILWVGIPAYYL